MCIGGENNLILIKLNNYVQVFYMVRLPSKKKKNPYLSTHFFFWHVTGNILFFLGGGGPQGHKIILFQSSPSTTSLSQPLALFFQSYSTLSTSFQLRFLRKAKDALSTFDKVDSILLQIMFNITGTCIL